MKKTCFLVIICLLFLMISCKEINTDFKVIVEKNQITIDEEIDFSIIAEDEIINDLIIYSSDESIIIINQNKIKGVSEGTADIIVEYLDTIKKYEIVVTSIPREINIDERQINLLEGEEKEINITSINCTYNVKITDNSVASFTDGKVKGIKEGTTQLVISANEDETVKKEITIIVEKKEENHDFSIELPETLEINKEYELVIKQTNPKDEFQIIYDQNILRIENSKITPLQTGTTTIQIINKISNEQKEIEIIIYEISEEAITNYLYSLYENMIVDNDVNFVKNYYDTDIEFSYSSDYPEYLSNTGIYNPPVLSKESEISIIWYYQNEEYCAFIPIVIKGWGNEFDVVYKYLDGLIPVETRRTLYLPTDYFYFDTVIDWYLNGELIEDGIFSFDRDDGENYNVVLKSVVKINGQEKIKEYTVKCIMKDSYAKALKVFDMYKNYYSEMIIDKDIIFPEYDESYSALLTWESFNAYILTSDGKYQTPFDTTTMKMKLIVTLGEYEKIGFVELTVKGIDHLEKWDMVEDVLKLICKEEIKTQKFYLYGCEEGYTMVRTQNIGYLPFYQMEELNVTEDILPDTSQLKPSKMRSSTKYITLHNTGMAHPTATAKGLNEYIHSTDRIASWHFSVDDREAYQHLKLGEVGWHAGDGSYSYGDFYYNETNRHSSIGGGNNNSVGIEICVYAGCDFNSTMRNVAKLVSKLLVYYGLTPSDIRQHYDFSGKNCPQVIREAGRWQEMLELIAIEYYIRTKLSDVIFKWESLSKDIMDDTGKIINNPNNNQKVKYKAIITIDGQTKEYTFESKLNSIK